MDLKTARVFVTDLATARQFYSEALGLPIKADGTRYGWCVFNAGGTDLVVEAVPMDAPEEDRALVGRFTGLSFTVRDAAATYREFAARGVPFTEPPEQQPWGGVIATLHDPSGNALQIVQHPTVA